MNPTAAAADEQPTKPGSGPLTIVWALLLLGCLLNYYLAEGQLSGSTLTMIVFGATFLKLGLITASFMELWSSGRAFLYIALGVFALTLGLIVVAW